MDQFVRERLEHLEGKVRRLEEQLAQVMKQLGIAAEDSTTAGVRELLRQGKKADAVVYWHRDKGGSLGEAAAAVERIAAQT